MATLRLAFVALGSNEGDSRNNLLEAMERLQALSSEPLRRSSLWRTTPVDCPPGSPDFLNAVVGMVPRPDETPESLQLKLQALELEFGRRPRQVRNEPRPLDLDLIAFGSETRTRVELTLPHPRAHLRKFVLAPLSEIASELVLPGQTHTVGQLLVACPTEEKVERVQSDSSWSIQMLRVAWQDWSNVAPAFGSASGLPALRDRMMPLNCRVRGRLLFVHPASKRKREQAPRTPDVSRVSQTH